jgi:hypothetical protein
MPLEKVHPAIQSAMQKLLYEAACEILAAEKEVRKPMLQKVPELIRPHVEAEVWRVWRMRNEV